MVKIQINVILLMERYGFTDPFILGEIPGFRIVNYFFG